MNREQKREFIKKAKSKGISKDTAEMYMDISTTFTGEVRPEKVISEGDKVFLDIEAIKSHPDYNKKSQKYKDFIESSNDEMFTAHIEHGSLISLAENPIWLFWSGNLILADKHIKDIKD